MSCYFRWRLSGTDFICRFLVYLYIWLITDGMFIVWAFQENILGILTHQTYILALVMCHPSVCSVSALTLLKDGSIFHL